MLHFGMPAANPAGPAGFAGFGGFGMPFEEVRYFTVLSRRLPNNKLNHLVEHFLTTECHNLIVNPLKEGGLGYTRDIEPNPNVHYKTVQGENGVYVKSISFYKKNNHNSRDNLFVLFRFVPDGVIGQGESYVRVKTSLKPYHIKKRSRPFEPANDHDKFLLQLFQKIDTACRNKTLTDDETSEFDAENFYNNIREHLTPFYKERLDETKEVWVENYQSFYNSFKDALHEYTETVDPLPDGPNESSFLPFLEMTKFKLVETSSDPNVPNSIIHVGPNRIEVDVDPQFNSEYFGKKGRISKTRSTKRTRKSKRTRQSRSKRINKKINKRKFK